MLNQTRIVFDLTSLWTNTILPWLETSGIRILFIIAGAFLAHWLINRFMSKAIRRAVPTSGFLTKEAEKKREDTLIGLFKGVARVLIFIIATLMVLGEFSVDVGPLLAGAGIAGVALGFGAQYLVRDLISGFFIVLENQYRVGDVVCFGETCGEVQSINLRTTILRDLDGVVHHIPNGEIKISSNMSKDFARININIGVDYKTDIDEAIAIINNVGEEMAKDPNWQDKIKTPPQFLRVNELGESSIVLKVLGETKPLEQWAVTGELRKRIKQAFDKHNIEIPYPHQVIKYVSETPTKNYNE